MRLFKNRSDAAMELAQHLAFLKDEKPIVLGLANGGVPLAEVIARQLGAPLDILLIEKLFAPNVPNQVVGAVDEHGLDACMESDVALVIPCQRVEENLFHSLRAVQNVRQKNAVVIAVRFGAEHGDRKSLRVTLQDLLDDTPACHAVADNDELFTSSLGHNTVLLTTQYRAPTTASRGACMRIPTASAF